MVVHSDTYIYRLNSELKEFYSRCGVLDPLHNRASGGILSFKPCRWVRRLPLAPWCHARCSRLCVSLAACRVHIGAMHLAATYSDGHGPKSITNQAWWLAVALQEVRRSSAPVRSDTLVVRWGFNWPHRTPFGLGTVCELVGGNFSSGSN